jgi:CheY-like chemotaxis protein
MMHAAAQEGQPYHLAILDLMMPEMDGYEVTTTIRRREGAAKHTPIIAMRAHAMDGEREKCLATGMDDYLSKPVNVEELGNMLEKWLSVSSTPPAIVITIEKDDSTPVDMERLLYVASGDEELLQELVELYLNQTSETIKRLNAAVATGDAGEVNRLAHSYIGGSATCGMNPIVTLLRDL